MILDKIVAVKVEEVARDKRIVGLDFLKNKIRERQETISLKKALNNIDGVALIAEIKKASPSKGVIRKDFNPIEIAKIYEENGASAISILTDESFFQGSLTYLEKVRKVSTLPLLRKEFIVDQYQIYQARAYGADAILLIAAILTNDQIREFLAIAKELSLECLVEVHTEEELLRVMELPVEIIGVNNRDLNTFKTDINTTFILKEKAVKDGIIFVSESGINHREDVVRLQNHKVNAMLVGEAIMRENNIAAKVKELLGRGL